MELLGAYTGKRILVETDTAMAFIGDLIAIDPDEIKLGDVTIFDDRVVKISLEEYILEILEQDAPEVREEMLIKQTRIICVSPLERIVK